MSEQKAVIKLDNKEIIENMWDGCQGQHVLAVAPDGNDHSIHWMEQNRSWDPWPNGWLIIGIPALDPDGSGQALEDAQDLLKLLRLTEKAEALMETDDIGFIEAIEQLAPEDWKANREMGYDWLADAFLTACNGDGNELNTTAPWGMAGDMYGNYEVVEPPAEFEWA